MKYLFLASGAFAIAPLEHLAVSGHQLVGIVTQPDRPAGRGQHLTETPIAQCAGAYMWDVLKLENVNSPEALEQLRALAPDVLVVIAFGQKLSPDLLALAPFGGINLHASLLPKYRGAAPINHALLNNDPAAGVSVIQLTQVMDGGDILASASTPIAPDETAGELHDRLSNLGAPLLPQVLDQLAAGTVRRVVQDAGQASGCPSCRASWRGLILASRRKGFARIRGLSPWPGVAVTLTDAHGKVRAQATLLKCRAVAGPVHEPESCGQVLSDRTVACGEGGLEILTIQPSGKKAMDVGALANGYGWAAGARLVSVIPVPK